MTDHVTTNAKRYVFIVFNAGSTGAIVNTTRHQAEYLAETDADVWLISNVSRVCWKGVRYVHINVFDKHYWKFFDALLTRVTNYLPERLGKRLDMNRVIPQWRFSYAASEFLSKTNESGLVCICSQHFVALGLSKLRARSGIPFVAVCHGDIFSHPQGAFSAPMFRLYEHSARVCYRDADAIVAVGQMLRERAVEFGATRENTFVIPNGLDASEIGLKDICSKISNDHLSLLFVGRLSVEKGTSVLIDAMRFFKDSQIRLKIVGAGHEMDSLRAQVLAESLVDSVDFVGGVRRAELYKYYCSADVLVIPSLSEAQSLVALEAQVCGLPVIATNVGGLPDLIKDGENGILVPPGDPEALAKAILHIAEDPGLIAKYSLKAMSMARRYEWKGLLEKFGSVLKQIEIEHFESN